MKINIISGTYVEITPTPIFKRILSPRYKPVSNVELDKFKVTILEERRSGELVYENYEGTPLMAVGIPNEPVPLPSTMVYHDIMTRSRIVYVAPANSNK